MQPFKKSVVHTNNKRKYNRTMDAVSMLPLPSLVKRGEIDGVVWKHPPPPPPFHYPHSRVLFINNAHDDD